MIQMLIDVLPCSDRGLALWQSMAQKSRCHRAPRVTTHRSRAARRAKLHPIGQLASAAIKCFYHRLRCPHHPDKNKPPDRVVLSDEPADATIPHRYKRRLVARSVQRSTSAMRDDRWPSPDAGCAQPCATAGRYDGDRRPSRHLNPLDLVTISANITDGHLHPAAQPSRANTPCRAPVVRSEPLQMEQAARMPRPGHGHERACHERDRASAAMQVVAVIAPR